MKLTFLGTRGEIDVRTTLHRMHSCLMVTGRILIDCGADWLGKLEALKPQAIVLTHAHPDHAGGLECGSPCAVYATAQTWNGLKRYPIRERQIIEPRHPVFLGGVEFEAFPVAHSLIAPAVGYRVSKGNVSVFYVPDLVYIHERHQALSGVALYIGDGASIMRPLVRCRGARSAGVGCARWPEAHVPHSMMANNVAQQRLANYAAWILAKSASTSVTGIASISQTAPTISRRS